MSGALGVGENLVQKRGRICLMLMIRSQSSSCLIDASARLARNLQPGTLKTKFSLRNLRANI